jgi:hypothetical protein
MGGEHLPQNRALARLERENHERHEKHESALLRGSAKAEPQSFEPLKTLKGAEGAAAIQWPSVFSVVL